GSALTAAVPYAAPAIASGLGISIKVVSLVGYGVVGGATNAAVEKATNPEATGSSIAIKTLEGVGGALLAAGIGELVSKIPFVQRIGNSMSHSQSAITPMAGGTITGKAPKGWYLPLINQDAGKLFAIGQVSGAFSNVVWEGIIRGRKKIFTPNKSKQEENKE
ncbi:MAG: hypothetical protein HDR24_00735, partial [Lachnospiraceae bacterium]|nr:hypothetical protein [Lachnospiraceae bacterium]